MKSKKRNCFLFFFLLWMTEVKIEHCVNTSCTPDFCLWSHLLHYTHIIQGILKNEGGGNSQWDSSCLTIYRPFLLTILWWVVVLHCGRHLPIILPSLRANPEESLNKILLPHQMSNWFPLVYCRICNFILDAWVSFIHCHFRCDFTHPLWKNEEYKLRTVCYVGTSPCQQGKKLCQAHSARLSIVQNKLSSLCFILWGMFQHEHTAYLAALSLHLRLACLTVGFLKWMIWLE